MSWGIKHYLAIAVVAFVVVVVVFRSPLKRVATGSAA